MDMEHGVLLHREEVTVELVIIFVLQVRGLPGPDGSRVVDDLVLVLIDVFPVLPLLFLAEGDGNRHKPAVLGQQFVDLRLRGEFLRFVVEVKCDAGTAVSVLPFAHLIFGVPLAFPSYGSGPLLIGESIDDHLPGYHESGIEPQSEMADYVLVLVLLEEFPGA